VIIKHKNTYFHIFAEIFQVFIIFLEPGQIHLAVSSALHQACLKLKLISKVVYLYFYFLIRLSIIQIVCGSSGSSLLQQLVHTTKLSLMCSTISKLGLHNLSVCTKYFAAGIDHKFSYTYTSFKNKVYRDPSNKMY